MTLDEIFSAVRSAKPANGVAIAVFGYPGQRIRSVSTDDRYFERYVRRQLQAGDPCMGWITALPTDDGKTAADIFVAPDRADNPAVHEALKAHAELKLAAVQRVLDSRAQRR